MNGSNNICVIEKNLLKREKCILREMDIFPLPTNHGRRSGLVVIVPDSRSKGPSLSLVQGPCFVSLSKTLYSHGAFTQEYKCRVVAKENACWFAK